mmetsp:Transcript_54742/g.131214  ORF Transcript_54742/g.131214 Transcript_54742/m.131214 type:complete len:215 (-) Transcript_54742:135-779(-)
MGWPAPSFIATSTSDALATPRSTSIIASMRKGTSKRLTTKPSVSTHSTGVLPSALAKPIALWKRAGSVCGVLTTSTSFMSCTGLKKWRPIICEGRPQKAPILCTARLDVFEAMMQLSETSLPMSSYSGFLRARSSMTASTTMSQPAKLPRSSEGLMRESVVATCTAASASLILPFLTAFSLSFFTLDSILAMPASRKRASDSMATTSNPFSAAV